MLADTPFQRLIFTTVRVQTRSLRGEERVGTSFGFLYECEGKSYPFLVTNRHVIEGATQGILTFTGRCGSQPDIGNRVESKLDNFENFWHCHHNADIAVMPLKPLIESLEKSGKPVYVHYFSNEIVPSAEQLSQLDVVEEIYFVGYPNGIYDNVNLLPIVRRGTTATPPQIDYDGKPTFMIDASVFGGSSGSPVLICRSGGIDSVRRTMFIGEKVLLLGVVSGVAIRNDSHLLEFISVPTTPSPGIRVNQELNLGLVVKSSTIIETIVELLRQHGVIEMPSAETTFVMPTPTTGETFFSIPPDFGVDGSL